MKFRFCGDFDCPDWVLAEIATLSKLSSVKVKLLCNQVISGQTKGNIDYDKVAKLTADAKFELGDTKSAIAALYFIVSSSIKYNVDPDSLSNELQQLGLPKEHAASLCKSYADNAATLQEEFGKQTLRLSKLQRLDWRVEFVCSSNHLKKVNEPLVILNIRSRKWDQQSSADLIFSATTEKLLDLLYELKQAHSEMESLAA